MGFRKDLVSDSTQQTPSGAPDLRRPRGESPAPPPPRMDLCACVVHEEANTLFALWSIHVSIYPHIHIAVYTNVHVDVYKMDQVGNKMGQVGAHL